MTGRCAKVTTCFCSSIVALKAKSGEYVRHFQEVHHDIWDYDAASPVVLFDIAINGPVSLRGEQAVRCFAGICRRSPLEGRESQRTRAWMGGDKDGRTVSPGRSPARVYYPGVACHQRRRIGAIVRRVFLSSAPSRTERGRERHRNPGAAARRVPQHLRHPSSVKPGGRAPFSNG